MTDNTPSIWARYRRQLTVLASLIFATALCFGLLVLRISYTRSLGYITLLWNLFLAWLPVVSSLVAYNLYRRRRFSNIVVVGAALIWLLFFPNAPYMMTDLMHLRPAQDVPLWYDTILLITFGWTGAFLGIVSLYFMHTLIRRAAGPVSGWTFALGALAAGSFGIYMGRFLRWNSWDIFTAPGGILADIFARLRDPIVHIQTYAFSMLFFLLMMASYWIVVALSRFSSEAEGPSERPASDPLAPPD